jgi:alanyl-tRNA synthetase
VFEGHDGYHNTFFEMLGSWSFDGAYSKKDACRIAWDFLTGPMSLDKGKLFVTYFSGSHEHLADDETKEIWKSIGVKDSHIIGFGSKENFWEMGATGPCGPSTEIHYDHKVRGVSGVNQGFEDLVELWNLVFMEERNPDYQIRL